MDNFLLARRAETFSHLDAGFGFGKCSDSCGGKGLAVRSGSLFSASKDHTRGWGDVFSGNEIFSGNPAAPEEGMG